MRVAFWETYSVEVLSCVGTVASFYIVSFVELFGRCTEQSFGCISNKCVMIENVFFHTSDVMSVETYFTEVEHSSCLSW